MEIAVPSAFDNAFGPGFNASLSPTSLSAFTPQALLAPGANGLSPELGGTLGTSVLGSAAELVHGDSIKKLMNPGGGFFGGMSGLDKVKLGLDAFTSLAGLYGSFKQLGIARDALNMQKEFGNANLNNQIKSYNTALADRSRARAAMEGQTPEQAQAYIDANRLSR